MSKRRKDKPFIVPVEMKVSLHPEGVLFLRQTVASSKDADGKPIVVGLVNFHTPCVDYKGQYVVFPLDELVKAAVQVIDENGG